jgi:type II secretory pathway pseudopilin PulG
MRSTDRRGFTLAESLLASTVLAIAVIGVAATLSASHAQDSAVQTNSQAVAVARQLMEEVAAKPLVVSDTTPGWPVETERVKYDSIIDYAGYNDKTPVLTKVGEEIDLNSPVYLRTVTLHQPATLFGTNPPGGELVIVEVSVRDAAGNGCSLRRLAGRVNLER